jgi:hypothetical protein
MAASIGIVLGSFGYVVFYYGAEMWAGRAVSIASASGFAKPPAATKGSGTSGLGDVIKASSPLLFFL